jgi:hypothetical protein
MSLLATQDQVYDYGEAGCAAGGHERPGDCVAVYARADFQGVSAIKDCDQEHRRPLDPRTGQPVPIWELNCPAHEAWICGDGKPKILRFEKNEDGGFRQERVSQMEPGWSRTIEGIELTPDQVRAEGRRNSLTRRAEQALLAEGMQNTRLALEHRPTARELLRSRALAGRGAVKMATCHACQADYLIGAQYCPQCAVRVSVLPQAGVVAATAEPAAGTEPAPAVQEA